MYSIGQLALILKVSTRTLRHYDEIGLLKPCNVNEENGYRYYDKEQISLAKNIIKLKECGLSLDEIKELKASGFENSYVVIKKRLSIIEDEIKKLISMKDNLYKILRKEDIIIKKGELPFKTYDIQIAKLDNINVISKRCTISTKDIGKVVGTLYEEISKNGLRIKGGHIVKYFENDFDPENADIEVCIPIESRKETKLKIHVIPKGTYVMATASSISEKGDVYESIINWINSNGYKISGNPLERYSVNYENGLFKIDIYYPINMNK